MSTESRDLSRLFKCAKPANRDRFTRTPRDQERLDRSSVLPAAPEFSSLLLLETSDTRGQK